MRSSQLSRDTSTANAEEAAPRNSSKNNTDVEQLRKDNDALRDRLSKLSEASLRISDDLDFEAVLQEVVDSARSLTGAKFGVLLTYNESGDVHGAITSGITSDEIELLGKPPEGIGLLGYLNEVRGPLRIADIGSHPKSVGFPANHPPMKTFLGMPIRNHGEHIGNIFLTEKQDTQEFNLEDEETIVMFASQAAHAISNSRRYEEVQRAKADLEALVNISPVGVVVFDAKAGKLISFNQEVRRIIGDIRMPDRPWEHLLEALVFRRADGRELSFNELPLSRVLQSGETVRAEEIVIHFPDGRSVTTLVNAAPIYADNGEIVSVVVAVQDMTPLEDLERLRAEFLGMVSEELRRPLTAIKGSATALMDIIKSLNPTEPYQLLRIIDQQTDLMRTQINSLIDLSRLETGAMSVSLETAEVADLTDNAAREFQRSYPGITVENNLPADLPQVLADKQRIDQVLKNLFSQATKYSSESSNIRVSATRIDIYVAISVSVAGETLPQPTSSQLLKILSRGRRRETGQSNGDDGLALAFCRTIVEAHGGRIRTERGGQARGTTYTFTLPAADEVTRDTGTAAALQAHTYNPTPSGKAKIMIAVEDSRVAAIIRRTLSALDYSTIPVFDLGEIDRILLNERPQLVLLDLPASEVEGLRLTNRLTDEYGVPVIVLSDKGDGESVVRALECGADDYVVKPFSSTELVARIKSSLRKRAVASSPGGPANYSLRDVAINFSARTLTVSGLLVQLTATEYKLLHELSSSAGRILTQDELLHRVWGPEYSGEPQLLRSYIKSLRQKLGDKARDPSYIFTEHGIGYRMAKP
jgi:two-component system KDP operon response regulator KdpE